MKLGAPPVLTGLICNDIGDSLTSHLIIIQLYFCLQF